MTPPDYDDLCARLRELYVQHGTNYVQAAAEAIESLREQNAALRLLLDDMKPHWDGFTRKVIWTAAMAGVMADIRTRLDAAMKDKP